jgi:hypothetical protein
MKTKSKASQPFCMRKMNGFEKLVCLWKVALSLPEMIARCNTRKNPHLNFS